MSTVITHHLRILSEIRLEFKTKPLDYHELMRGLELIKDNYSGPIINHEIITAFYLMTGFMVKYEGLENHYHIYKASIQDVILFKTEGLNPTIPLQYNFLTASADMNPKLIIRYSLSMRSSEITPIPLYQLLKSDGLPPFVKNGKIRVSMMEGYHIKLEVNDGNIIIKKVKSN